jgi:hypothetical protein
MAEKLDVAVGTAIAVTIPDARLEYTRSMDNPKNVFFKNILVAIVLLTVAIDY